ncbi:MAG: multidrug effflux MFS transporter [Rhodospirillales bacterium]|jgi:MFS transporter, DHA1 family, multidrug resistance protein|nr:multidrug effflux MFS transporter [Rhodospirillales bacterium]
MRYAEFIALMALVMSTVAMSTDAVLPALSLIGQELGAGENQRQLVIGALFLGLASSQVFFGPLSDRFGRKPVILFGFAVFAIGCLISIGASNFEAMLVGRFVQGLGAAGPRVISTAMIRDRFEGREMAKIMSTIMTLFILVPVFAPAIGQGILTFTHWRGIFWFFIAMGVGTSVWMAVRMAETLRPENRHPLTISRVGGAFREIFTHPVTMGYLLAMSCVFSAFVGYLSTAQQIFQELYGLGAKFPLAFGCMAGTLGLASFINSRLVVRLGMRVLIRRALATNVLLAGTFTLVAYTLGGVPPLWLVFAFMMPVFFCHGTVFGNIQAMAMQPMGHIAGSAAAVIGAVATTISTTVGSMIGQAFNGTVLPLALSFTVLPLLALLFSGWANRHLDANAAGGHKAEEANSDEEN